VNKTEQKSGPSHPEKPFSVWFKMKDTRFATLIFAVKNLKALARFGRDAVLCGLRFEAPANLPSVRRYLMAANGPTE
jgi:hypothetical protein